MRLIDVPTTAQPIHVALYGVSNAHKTWMSCHLPEEWGKIVYIAADFTSPSLESVIPGDRGRLYPYVPDGNVKEVQGHLVTDWTAEFNKICQTNWKEIHTDAGVIVWDTVTGSSYKLLNETRKMSSFPSPSTAKVTKDDPRFQLHKEEHIATGDKGDYRLVIETVVQGLDWLLSRNQNMHIICTFHQCTGDGAEGGVGKKFGPSITGLKGPLRMPHLFGATLHLSVEGGQLGKAGDTRILLQERDNYISGVKNPGKDYPPFKHVGRDPNEVRAFWSWLQKLKE